MRKMWILPLAVLLCVGAAYSQEGKEEGKQEREFDKNLHPWAKWKVGSWVKLKISMETPMGNQEGESKQTLKEIDEEEYTIEMEQSMMGQSQTTEETQGYPEYLKDDAVKVGDEEFKCTVWKIQGDRGEQESVTKFWVDEKNDRLLKMTVEVGESQSIETTAVKFDEEVKIAEKVYKTVKMKGRIKVNQGGQDMEGDITVWMNNKIPGGTAKMTIEMEIQGMEIKQNMEVSSFEAKE